MTSPIVDSYDISVPMTRFFLGFGVTYLSARYIAGRLKTEEGKVMEEYEEQVKKCWRDACYEAGKRVRSEDPSYARTLELIGDLSPYTVDKVVGYRSYLLSKTLDLLYFPNVKLSEGRAISNWLKDVETLLRVRLTESRNLKEKRQLMKKKLELGEANSGLQSIYNEQRAADQRIVGAAMRYAIENNVSPVNVMKDNEIRRKMIRETMGFDEMRRVTERRRDAFTKLFRVWGSVPYAEKWWMLLQTKTGAGEKAIELLNKKSNKAMHTLYPDMVEAEA